MGRGEGKTLEKKGIFVIRRKTGNDMVYSLPAETKAEDPKRRSNAGEFKESRTSGKNKTETKDKKKKAGEVKSDGVREEPSEGPKMNENHPNAERRCIEQWAEVLCSGMDLPS